VRTAVEAKIPTDQAEYLHHFSVLHRIVVEFEPAIPFYSCYFKDEILIRLIAICVTVKHQQNLLSSVPAKYILELPVVRSMVGQIQTAADILKKALRRALNEPADIKTASTYFRVGHAAGATPENGQANSGTAVASSPR